MRSTVFNSFKGDRLIWAIIILLATISFLPVYSAASNLAYIGGSGNTFGYLLTFCSYYFGGGTHVYGA